MNLSRRDLLKVGLFSSAALMLPAERIARTQLALTNRIPESQLPAPFTVPFATPPVLQPEYQTAEWAYYSIEQRQVQAEILPGLRTTIWGYNGITPGPTIVNQQGQQALVRQINRLPDVHPFLRYNVWTSTHLHGSCSLPQYDGYASDITLPGDYKDYKWPNEQDARTLWYHDHGVHITAENAYMGLAAQYILHDPLELSLPIPHGKYDVPLVLKDAMFDQSGELIMDNNSESGIYGDVVLVNGRPWPLMAVEPRKYRFRVLNAGVGRSYDLSLDTGEPLTVIGTDGGLMPHPQPVSHLKVGMAERYEVVIDFSKYRPGQRVVLKNTSPKNNIDYDTVGVVMAFHVGDHVSDSSNNDVPRDLNPNMNVMGLTEKDSVKTRHFRFERDNGSWTINGTTWEDVINSDFDFVLADPGFDDVEIWELENKSGGWFHPVHIHLVDFKILDRNGRPPEPYEMGPKDVVYLGENETVRLIMRFEHHEGRYMIHCHNLVHEDHDMMGQFRVGPHKDDDADHPVNADPSKKMPAPPLFVIDDDGDDDGDSGSGSGSGGDGRIREGVGNSQRTPSSSSGSAPASGSTGPSGRSTPSSGTKGATDTSRKKKKRRVRKRKHDDRDDRHRSRRKDRKGRKDRDRDRGDRKRRSRDRKGRKRRTTNRRKRS
jgi:FtsP/CotA-like multicopper oxidase with cupredoxin domain